MDFYRGNVNWKTESCNTKVLPQILCQFRACDATNLFCCKYCNMVKERGSMISQTNEQVMGFDTKKRYNRGLKKLSRKPIDS